FARMRSGRKRSQTMSCWLRFLNIGWKSHQHVRAAEAMNVLEADSGRLLAAVRALLEQKGIASTTEIHERMTITDAGGAGQGARMVAKAWVDPAYRALMLRDGTKAAEELGIMMRGMPPLGVL